MSIPKIIHQIWIGTKQPPIELMIMNTYIGMKKSLLKET